MTTTTAYKPPQTEDKKGLAVQMDQLIDSNGVAVNVSDLTALVGNPSLLRLARTTIAAAGSTVTDATPITTSVVTVTASDGTKGVVLPSTPVAGTVVIVKNTVAAVLKVWPDAAAAINAIATHGAISMAASTSAMFIADSTTQWYTVPLLPS